MYKKIILSLFFLLIASSLVLTPVTNAATNRTNTKWISTNKDGVEVTPYVRVDKKALFIDFEGFNGVEYVYYNFNYTQQDNGVKGGVEGSFIPGKEIYTGYYKGKPYVRYEFPFGSCSKKVCVLHRVKDVKLTVNTKMKNGKHFSKIINLPQDQF